MAQHFLLSAASRTTSLRAIYKAGEEAAYDTFCEMRWPETDGEAVCPCCGFDEAYKITTRRKFKCKACHHQFSVTTPRERQERPRRPPPKREPDRQAPRRNRHA